jgi:tubulin polyglutamylase TTLL6/13
MEKLSSVNKKSKLICNVAFTRYEVVRYVARKNFGWKLVENEEDDKWDILWTDSAVPPEKLAKMQLYQKINHFPGMYAISRKNYLAMNLTKLKRKFPNDYNFFPKTWLLPCDMSDLKSFLQSKKNSYLILKPEASCQGRGIFLTRKLEAIDPNSRYVAQEYITKPFLIENLKFDLRIYVLIAGCDPLRIFVHEEGLTRFATEDYSKPSPNNIEEMCMHLTNYAVNKNNPNFIQNEDSGDENSGHKRSLQSTYHHLSELGYNIEALKQEIDKAIIKTLCSIQPSLAHHYKSCQPEDYSNSMCFEVLGFDVILDSKARPWVLEVNHTPSFTTDSPLDWKVKKKVIKDTLTIMNISSAHKTKFLKKQKEEILKRALTGKLEKETKEEKEEKISDIKNKRDKWESKHTGGYRKIYPVENKEEYDKFILSAKEIYQDWTGANINRSKKCLPEKINKNILTTNILKKTKTNSDIVPRCNSIPNLVSPNISDKNNYTVFERLSKPAIKKYRSTRVAKFPPLVYYDDIKTKAQKLTHPSSRIINGRIDSRALYSRNSGYKQMIPKIFQFKFDKNFD